MQSHTVGSYQMMGLLYSCCMAVVWLLYGCCMAVVRAFSVCQFKSAKRDYNVSESVDPCCFMIIRD